MFDWIVEADIYRLKKAASEATNPRERRELEALAQQKLAAVCGGSRKGTARRVDA
jgi:hypothetical protein